MTVEGQTKSERAVGVRSLALVAVVLMIIITGWALVTVSSTLPPPSDFVVLPNSQLSNSGTPVTFAKVSPLMSNGVADGVSGYLLTTSGTPVSGATVYMTYYLQGSYRTQQATTDETGYFMKAFPMNWTGSLPLTLVYFGGNQYKGIQQVVNVAGENIAIRVFL